MTQSLRSRAAVSLVAVGILASACKEDVPAKQGTEILVEISSDNQNLDTLVMRVRAKTPAGESDVWKQDSARLDGKDLSDEPFELLLKPQIDASGTFFIHVQGQIGGETVAAGAKQVEFKKGERTTVKLALDGGFIDADGDGYPKGVGAGFDCNDANPNVSPYREENCTDLFDNNCAGGILDDGCGGTCTTDIPCTDIAPANYDLVGVGKCTVGHIPCVDGVPGDSCIGAGSPDVEVDNLIDDDCDGSVDEVVGECQAGETRPCHLGFVDDGSSTVASDLAQGECAKPDGTARGTQSCGSTLSWGNCIGDVIPTRAPSSFEFKELATACDGLDNDCDGLFDEEPDFDTDSDGYTYCGSTFTPAPNAHTQGGLQAEDIDCADGNPNAHPGLVEVCGNTVDEDCLCDHDDVALASGDPTSQIGVPSKSLDGTPNCDGRDYLDCEKSRSIGDDGQCNDANGTVYYRSFANHNGDRACISCSIEFGVTCLLDGTCSTRVDDCESSCGAVATATTDVAETRPVCRAEAAGTCTGTVGPSWDEVAAGTDAEDDCPVFQCSSSTGGGPYYNGISSAPARCYYKDDIDSYCQAGAVCEDKATACTRQSTAGAEVTRALCRTPVSGCTGTTAPTFGNVADATDPYNECDGALTCNGAGACHKTLGDPCGGDAECESNACECANASCSSRRCAVSTCSCSFLTGTDGVCNDGFITSNTDPDNSCTGNSGTDICDGAGACKRSLGTSCTGDSECLSGACECADASCSARRCATSTCSCTFLSGTDGICNDGFITSNTDPDNSCSGTDICNGAGVCKKALGSTCAGDSECLSNACECADGTCTTRRCATATCSCTFLTGTDGICNDGFISSNTDPDNSCTGADVCNGSGSCEKALGSPCSGDSECLSDACECADASCATRRCATATCSCTYLTGTDGICNDGFITTNTDPDSSCSGSDVCDGSGNCKKALGTLCSGDSECLSSACECADASCTARRCATAACACTFLTGTDGICNDGFITTNTDPDNSCSGTDVCNGAGACRKVLGSTCGGDSECLSNACECADASCSTRRCATATCSCTFLSGADGICNDGFITSNTDPDNSCTGNGGTDICNGAGACKRSLGTTCSSDNECLSDACECADASCSTRRCATASCSCTFLIGTDGLCNDGFITSNTDPDNSCAGTDVCDGSGNCKAALGTICSSDSDCLSNACECANAGCTSRRCATATCNCTFLTGTDGVCDDGFITSNTDPDNSCTGNGGSDICDGAGSCKMANGSTCNNPSDCLSNLCECASADCSVRECNALACDPCTYTISGICSGNIDAGIDPENVCSGFWCGTGMCDPSCGSNDDSQCKPTYHCEAQAGPDQCVADYDAGGPCAGPQDCISDSCTGGFCD